MSYYFKVKVLINYVLEIKVRIQSERYTNFTLTGWDSFRKDKSPVYSLNQIAYSQNQKYVRSGGAQQVVADR